MTSAVRYAECNWGKLKLIEAFWRVGKTPHSLLELTPAEFKYLCLAPEPMAENTFDDAVIRAVVTANDERGRQRQKPKIPQALKAKIEGRNG